MATSVADPEASDLVNDLVGFISPSRLKTWFRCQQQWAYVYVEGIRQPPSAAMAAGTAFDKAVNHAYIDKMTFGVLPTPDDMRASFASKWDSEAESVPDLNAEDRGAILDDGVNVCEPWLVRVARHVEPESVQREVRFDVELVDERERDAAVGIENRFVVRGFTDLEATIDGKAVVVDHKLSRSRSWSAADALREIQPVVYCMGANRKHFQFHIGKPAKAPEKRVQVIARDVSDDEIRQFCVTTARARRQIANAIRTGDFVPNRGHTLCSKRWCGHWQRCVADNGGTVAD